MNIVGVKEAAEILGWSRKKVSAYYPRGNFPKPIKTLYSGPIWYRAQIERYKRVKILNEKVFLVKEGLYYECFYNKSPVEIPITLIDQAESYYLVENKDVIKALFQLKELRNAHDLEDTKDTAIYRDFHILADY